MYVTDNFIRYFLYIIQYYYIFDMQYIYYTFFSHRTSTLLNSFVFCVLRIIDIQKIFKSPFITNSSECLKNAVEIYTKLCMFNNGYMFCISF